MRYLVAGEAAHVPRPAGAPPLLLIHGLLGSSFSWRRNLPGLARRSLVIAPDMLGAGFSERPARLDCRLPAASERLLRFMDALNIECFDLVGASHGGAVAAGMAAMAPGRVHRLVLAAPVNPWSKRGWRRVWFLSTRLGGGACLRVAPMLKPFYGYILRRMYGDPRRIPPDSLEGYSSPIEIPGTLPHLLRVMACWRADLEELKRTYRRIEAETLLIWGERDRAVPPESAKEVGRQLVRSKLVILPTVGHLPYEEAAEVFNNLVTAFLQNGET
jgi:pimeloyl-ACP methyl ester carboxylesterase